jgi:hypothetical protein
MNFTNFHQFSFVFLLRLFKSQILKTVLFVKFHFYFDCFIDALREFVATSFTIVIIII